MIPGVGGAGQGRTAVPRARLLLGDLQRGGLSLFQTLIFDLSSPPVCLCGTCCASLAETSLFSFPLLLLNARVCACVSSFGIDSYLLVSNPIQSASMRWMARPLALTRRGSCSRGASDPVHQIRDLLAKDPKNNLELKENLDTGVYVKDLTTFVVKSAIEIDQVHLTHRPE